MFIKKIESQISHDRVPAVQGNAGLVPGTGPIIMKLVVLAPTNCCTDASLVWCATISHYTYRYILFSPRARKSDWPFASIAGLQKC